MSEMINSDDNTVRLFNEAMVRLVTRADLENHMIGRAIVCELLKHEYMKFEELHANVENAIETPMTDKHVRRHIEFVNEKFRFINNMDLKHEIVIAQIYEITVEVDGRFYTRLALVHNIRKHFIKQRLFQGDERHA